MKKLIFALAIMNIAIFAACSKKSSASKTPQLITTTYTADIAPLMQAKCTPCHLPSKGGRKADFENYESLKRYGGELLGRVQLNPGNRGFMPMRNPKLSEVEITVIKKWIEQGMLEK